MGHHQRGAFGVIGVAIHAAVLIHLEAAGYAAGVLAQLLADLLQRSISVRQKLNQ